MNSSSSRGESVDELDNQIDRKLDIVQWEYHLLGSNASKTIRDQVLTIHHLFIGLTREPGLMTRVLKCLPIPLVRGGLAWFRVSF